MRIGLKLPLEPFGAARTGARAMPVTSKGRCSACGTWRTWVAQLFMRGKYRKWRSKALPYFLRARIDECPLTGPLELRMLIVMPFRKGDARKTMMVPRKWHVARPDKDNVEKAVLDCAQEAGWFLNDWQVARGVVEKVYAAQGEDPGISIIVQKLETPYHLR